MNRLSFAFGLDSFIDIPHQFFENSPRLSIDRDAFLGGEPLTIFFKVLSQIYIN
jgi:hypothetical protein